MKKFINKFNSKQTFLLILGIFVITIFFRFFSLLSFRDSSVVLEKGELIPFKRDTTLTQTFVANRDNLMKIEFLFRSSGPKPASEVKVEIADETCSNPIRKGNLSVPFLNSDNLYEFNFSKIPNSNGKKYCIITTYKPTDPASKGLRLFSMNKDNTQIKNITTGETFDGKTLSIRGVYTNDNLGQDISELNKRISQYKPWFLKHFYIGTIATLFIILSIFLVVILITI